MRVKVVLVAVLAVLVLASGTALAQIYGGYGAPGQTAKPYVRAKVGWFFPTESGVEGDVAFGLDYLVPRERPSLLYLSVDRLRATNDIFESTTWSLMGGAYMRGPQGFYYGAGIGAAREERDTIFGDSTDTRFAWEIAGGKMVGRNGFAEIRYRDGGSDGNRGPVICLGVMY